MKSVFNKANQDQISTAENTNLEAYFSTFRRGITGVGQEFESPYGTQRILYADWTASGRLYAPIEEKLSHEIGPYVANTHTQSAVTGSAMTMAYHQAREIIKKHVNAGQDDILITEGSGMTGVINKFQRILGIKVSENLKMHTEIPDHLQTIVFVSHMEHHSNQTSWMETIARVEVIPPDENGLPCLESLEMLLTKYSEVPKKIAAVTACSNVTGIVTNYHAIAEMMHKHGGLCFVDFACSAPYVVIDMHPENAESYLDAITFSPHKFLGGPGSSGVLVFHKKLYNNAVPDHPGGGTVSYTNPWGDRDYINDIETREDGGTPGFLQAIKTALAIKLKEKMGVSNIIKREHELNAIVFERFSKIDNLRLLAEHNKDRLSIFSFYLANVHYNLVVKLLNDRFGIQTRGGCSCAGTYGHYLLNVDVLLSKSIEQKILSGCLVERPGWIRMSMHPTMNNDEIHYICDAIEQTAKNIDHWKTAYKYDSTRNEFIHLTAIAAEKGITGNWFKL